MISSRSESACSGLLCFAASKLHRARVAVKELNLDLFGARLYASRMTTKGFAVWFGPEIAEAISKQSAERRAFILKTISETLGVDAPLERKKGRPRKSLPTQ